MPRQKRPRHISGRPQFRRFTPENQIATGETAISLEGFEAIRLIDYQGLGQAEAAELMNVSRQTFGRILKEARFHLTEALVTGKRFRVGGGCYEIRSPGRGQRRRRRASGACTIEIPQRIED